MRRLMKMVIFALTFSMVEKMMKKIAGNKKGNKYTTVCFHLCVGSKEDLIEISP